MSTIRIVLQPAFRPYLILAIVILLMSAVDAGQGRFLTIATAFSALQTFATYGLVALGLGLTILIGEFDLSVAGVFGLAGCVALLRTREPPGAVQRPTPAEMITAITRSARQVGSRGWNEDFGFGIINPLGAANDLGIRP